MKKASFKLMLKNAFLEGEKLGRKNQKEIDFCAKEIYPPQEAAETYAKTVVTTMEKFYEFKK